MYEGGMKKGRMPRCWLSRPDCGDPAAVRTQDLEFRRLSLYPAELQGLFRVGAPRFELGISCSQSRRDNRASLCPEHVVSSKKTPCWASLPGGEGGIRTPGTLIEYDSLANCWFQPLTHLSVCFDLTKKHRFLSLEKRCKSTNFFETGQIFLTLFCFCFSLCFSFILIDSDIYCNLNRGIASSFP